MSKQPPGSRRRGMPQAEAVRRSDVPYTMKLPDGRTVYVEVPGRMVRHDRGGELGFTMEGVKFLDRVRALATPLTEAPRPAFIATLRESLGMTQAEFGRAVGVAKMTVSRWERGTIKPSAEAVANIRKMVDRAKRRGVLLAG